MLLQMTWFYSFLWLSSIPLSIRTTSSSVHLLMDIHAVSISWLLQTALRWTQGCMYLFWIIVFSGYQASGFFYSIPGKIPWRGDRLPAPVFLSFPCGSACKESAWNAGDLGLIPGLGRSPGEGKAYPLQYSGLENSIDCIDHGVAKSQTWLSDFHFKVILMYGWDGEPLWLTYSPRPDPIAKLSTLQCYLDLSPRISSFPSFLKIQMNI